MRSNTPTFSQLGDIFNDATARLEGGITARNSAIIQQDLIQVQTGLEQLIQKSANQLQGVAGIHAQNLVDQINLELSAIKSVGTDPFAAKFINDVHRDMIDIVQGDSQLQSLATQGGHNGFGAVPSLLVAPAQFHGNAQQTEFMKTFVTTSQSFADKAVALADHHATPQETQALIADVQNYAQTVNAFTQAQGGLYSARFDNEFAANGVNGTATRALVDGLQTGNVDKVHAAAEVLAANAADVAGNMLGLGATPPPVTTGIPAHIDSFAQAGTIFNDATAKLIGGVYDGNRQSIHNDLAATQQGIKDLMAQHADQFQGKAGTHANQIIKLLGTELSLIDDVNSGPNAGTRINHIQSQITKIVANDSTLAAQATADGANGFMKLPAAQQHRGEHEGDGGNHGVAAANPNPMPHESHQHADYLAHIFASHADHAFG